MKKKLCLFMTMVLGLVLITGCENPITNEGGSDSETTAKYEVHLYDKQFKHTEEIEASYDDKGNLETLAAYTVYDAAANARCGTSKPAKDYTDAKYECTKNSDGSVKYYSYVTIKSIQEGALEDKVFSDLDGLYEEIGTEEKMNTFIDDMVESLKESNTISDEKNYIIRNGEKINW